MKNIDRNKVSESHIIFSCTSVLEASVRFLFQSISDGALEKLEFLRITRLAHLLTCMMPSEKAMNNHGLEYLGPVSWFYFYSPPNFQYQSYLGKERMEKSRTKWVAE